MTRSHAVCVARPRPRPSYAQEVVEGNVIVGKDGEVHSKCGTHLGHNLPDAGDPRSRYCLDLVCLAGNPNSELALWASLFNRRTAPSLGF